MSYQDVILQVLSGLSVGMVIFIIAAGLSIVFGTLRVLNLAHGSLYMVGAYLALWFTSKFPQLPSVFLWNLILVPVIVALIGGIIEIVLIRRIYNREDLDQFLLTFALIFVIGDLTKIIWGVGFHMVPMPGLLKGAITIFGRPFPLYNLFLMSFGTLFFLGIVILIRYTRLGKITRAVIYNREIVNALGINVPLVYTGVFVLGCWMAGLGGVLISPMASVLPGMDSVLIDCFIIVVIGGLGSMPGAFLGSIIFGLTNAFGILVFPRLTIAFGFILMSIVLVIRPWGLMGKPE